MIIKFQQGGLAPLVSYQPVTVTGGTPSQAPTASSSQAKSGNDLTDDDLLKMLDKLDGLPSDMSVLINKLQNFYIDQKYSPDTSSIASRYLQLMGDLKIANHNKAEYDKAFEIVSKNGGLNEYAISDRGQLFCVNSEGDFKLLSVDQLNENSDYTPLTNSELLYYRAEHPDMANKNNILKVVKNGVGIGTVTEMIKSIISQLGSTQESNEGYGKVNSGQIVTGLQDFIQAVQAAQGQGHNGTIHDLYKYRYLTKSQEEQANQAISYIYNTLPENMKSLLKIKSGKLSEIGAKELIQTLVSSQIDTTKNFTLDLIGGPTAKSTTKSTNNKSDSELNTSLPLNVQKSQGGYDQDLWIDKGNGIQMSISGTYYSQIKTPNGEPIIDTSLQSMLAESGLQSIVQNTKNITFGDQKLSQEQLANITYNNTGMIRANLPVNNDGTVRLDILEDFEKAQAEIKLLGDNISSEQIREIYETYNLGDLLTSDGTPNPKKFAPFIVTEGYTTEKNGITDSEFVKKKNNITEQEINLIKKSLTIGTGKDKEIPEIDTFDWWNPFDWFGVEDIYKAAIYIPITNNTNAAVYGANQELDQDEALDYEMKYRNFEKLNGMNSTKADVL